MSHNPFGWSYPAGAEHDPNAPWNQENMPDDYCEGCESYGHRSTHPVTQPSPIGPETVQLCEECAADLEAAQHDDDDE